MSEKTKDIPKAYSPAEWEDRLYRLWEESGYFDPDNIESSQTYCNILPPPNANGELHIGHASGYTVMDVFGRYQRMRGKKVLLLPGKDHAGIQTQVVFEKKLKDERGLTRYDLGREKFFEECYAFCIDRADYMRSGEKKIGLSADWSREKFTLDPEATKIALETFVKMYEDGLIYRGKRIINWCPRCATALSDIEVVHKEIDGELYFIKYLIKDAADFITVATTRPETMLGDTAVAVHPQDKRYAHFVGKTVLLPLQNREIPIIADEKIDMEYGTGAVKITPAHDALDWQIGREHSLPEIQVINEKAEITPAGGKYEGLTTPEARKEILHDLSDLKLLERTESVKINISLCERCKTVIEPLISLQWFVNVDAPHFSLKQEVLTAVEAGDIVFFPKNFQRLMAQWLNNLHDWCISRQIWWGHRIPVWYHDTCQVIPPEGVKKDGTFDMQPIVSIDPPSQCPYCSAALTHNGPNATCSQDPDTLDTWFSSGQWPFTTLGYPDGKDYTTFFPTDTMIMGRDILFFWATRMIMMSLYRTGRIPFKNLYFTGLIRDKEGRKMSKSRGNGIEAMEMIKTFGADALRLSLIVDTAPGTDSRLYEEKIESFRNFANKLWNIARYCLSHDDFNLHDTLAGKDIKTAADRWIVGELQAVFQTVTRFIENKQIGLATDTLKSFTWNTLADWYIEVHKLEKNDTVLGYVLNTTLKLWHPFIPFVTEAIFQSLNTDKRAFLMMKPWPEAETISADFEQKNQFENILSLITAVRNIRSVYRIEPKTFVALTVVTNDANFIESQSAIIKRLARVSEISVTDKAQTPKASAQVLVGAWKVFVHLEGIIDVTAERERLGKELANLKEYVNRTQTRLNNPSFTEKAPADIIANTRVELDRAQSRVVEIEKHLGDLRE